MRLRTSLRSRLRSRAGPARRHIHPDDPPRRRTKCDRGSLPRKLLRDDLRSPWEDDDRGRWALALRLRKHVSDETDAPAPADAMQLDPETSDHMLRGKLRVRSEMVRATAMDVGATWLKGPAQDLHPKHPATTHDPRTYALTL